MELMGCQGLAVPSEVMHHVVRVESSYNRYAIGVVGGRLVRQPKNLPEALATVRMLEGRGFNFSIGLAQVNRYNLDKYGLDSYEEAFEPCANLRAGSKILAECYHRAGRNWGKSFSCYYSGNFSTGFRHGYVQKIYASLRQGQESSEPAGAPAIDVVSRESRRSMPVARHPLYSRAEEGAAAPPMPGTPQSAPISRPRWAARIVSDTSRAEPVGTSVQASSVEQVLEAASRQPEPAIVPVPAVAAADVPGRAIVMPAASEPARAVPAGAVTQVPAAGVPPTVAQPVPASQAPTRDRAMILNAPSQDRAFVF